MYENLQNKKHDAVVVHLEKKNWRKKERRFLSNDIYFDLKIHPLTPKNSEFANVSEIGFYTKIIAK